MGKESSREVMLLGKVVSCPLPWRCAMNAAVTATTPSLSSWNMRCSDVAHAIGVLEASTARNKCKALMQHTVVVHIAACFLNPAKLAENSYSIVTFYSYQQHVSCPSPFCAHLPSNQCAPSSWINQLGWDHNTGNGLINLSYFL
jgi:hypothetical protein